jgi:hypothetical protein
VGSGLDDVEPEREVVEQPEEVGDGLLVAGHGDVAAGDGVGEGGFAEDDRGQDGLAG